MKTNILTYLLVSSLILSSPIASASSSHIEGDSEGNTIVIGRGETTTAPGGFSAVAEPAGPADPEAAAIYAATYQFACVIIPNLLSHATGGKPVTVHEMCTAQVNTGAPLTAGPTTVSNEQVARLIPHGSGINRYPSGEVFVIFKQPMMVWTSPDKQTFNITLLRLRRRLLLLTGTGETDSPSTPPTPAPHTLTTRSVTPMRLLVTAM